MPRSMKYYFIFLSIFFTLTGHSKNDLKASQKRTGHIIFKIVNIQNIKKGYMLVLLYNKKNWAPDKPEKAIKIIKINLHSSSQKVIIKNIPFGTYALSLIHDINKNNQLDTRWFPPGMPSEDVGTSNNAEGGPFGAPPWSKAKFIIDKREVNLKTIKMAHLYQ